MNLSEMVYQALKQDIETNLIPNGSFLSESQLAERFGVSKAPVKTALKMLCEEYYLVAYPRKGYRVSILSDEEFSQLKETRIYYEQFSIEQAIIRASDDEIKALLNPADRINVNARFHMRLAELSKNRYHINMMSRLMKFQYTVPLSDEQINDSHEKIVKALLSRDLVAAQFYLSTDIIMA